MIFYLIGVDYKTAPLEVREAAYRLRKEIIGYWQSANPGRVAVLVTCNRLEIYGVANNLYEASEFHRSFKACFENISNYAHLLYGKDEVLRYGLRLICGLKSQIRGEFQIMEQLETWFRKEDFPEALEDIWGYILKTGAIIRRQAGLNKDRVVDASDLVFNDLSQNICLSEDTKIMVIGTGKVASLIAHRKDRIGHLIFVARKKRVEAESLASISGGEALLRQDMPAYLNIVDAVISATSSPHYVLTMNSFAEVLNMRSKVLHVYDLALPRDVSPEVDNLPFVRMRNLDDLTADFSKRKSDIDKNLAIMTELIEDKIAEYKEYVDVEEYKAWNASQPACLQAG